MPVRAGPAMKAWALPAPKTSVSSVAHTNPSRARVVMVFLVGRSPKRTVSGGGNRGQPPVPDETGSGDAALARRENMEQRHDGRSQRPEPAAELQRLRPLPAEQ